MKTPLFELLGISEEKKELLLLLYAGSKEKESILFSMGISRQALVPHIRPLEERGLITDQDGTYKLTGMGKIAVGEMIPFLETLEFIDSASDLLGDYKLDFIPSDLLGRFHEIGALNAKEPILCEIHEPDKEFMSTVSTSFSVITSFLYPTFAEFTAEMMDRGVDISVIIDQAMLGKMKRDRYVDFKKLVEDERSSVYFYPDSIDFVSFSVTDSCIMFRLFKKDDVFDNKLITACNDKAVKWGRELFEHYRKRSKKLDKI